MQDEKESGKEQLERRDGKMIVERRGCQEKKMSDKNGERGEESS
jgi:hypothetical protein